MTEACRVGEEVLYNNRRCRITAVYYGLPAHAENCRMSHTRQRFFQLKDGIRVHDWIHEKLATRIQKEETLYVQTSSGAAMLVRLVKK